MGLIHAGLSQKGCHALGFQPEPAKKIQSNVAERPNEDEDDDDDEDDVEIVEGDDLQHQVLVDQDMQVDEDRNSHIYLYDTSSVQRQRSPCSLSPTLRGTRQRLSIACGLIPSQKAYFDCEGGEDIWERQLSDADMALERRYAAIAELSSAPRKDLSSVQVSAKLKDSSGMRNAFCKLGPAFEFQPSFFTVDSAFHVRY